MKEKEVLVISRRDVRRGRDQSSEEAVRAEVVLLLLHLLLLELVMTTMRMLVRMIKMSVMTIAMAELLFLQLLR